MPTRRRLAKTHPTHTAASAGPVEVNKHAHTTTPVVSPWV